MDVWAWMSCFKYFFNPLLCSQSPSLDVLTAAVSSLPSTIQAFSSPLFLQTQSGRWMPSHGALGPSSWLCAEGRSVKGWTLQMRTLVPSSQWGSLSQARRTSRLAEVFECMLAMASNLSFVADLHMARRGRPLHDQVDPHLG